MIVSGIVVTSVLLFLAIITLVVSMFEGDGTSVAGGLIQMLTSGWLLSVFIYLLAVG